MTLTAERHRIRLRQLYADEHRASVRVASDYRRRQPADLRDAARLCRKAYADEVPLRLAEHTIGDDGGPRFAGEATAYILGSAQRTDARPGADPEFVDYYRTPFRAALEQMQRRNERSRLMAAIVLDVARGSGPLDAAIRAGVTPDSIARDIAELALETFLRLLSDIRVDGPRAATTEPLALRAG